MIRCSHCGKLAPSGAASCQGCGMPLVNANNDVRTAGVGRSEQPELPAWLESLRAHERPVSNSAGAQPFSTDELVDQDALPNWMRQDQLGQMETGNSDAFPVLPPNARPGASTHGPVSGPNGLEASSLIDEQSLPPWIRGEAESAPPVSGVAGEGLSANSLVQRETLPDWMKNLGPGTPQSQPSQHYGLPAQSPFPPTQTADMMRMPQTPPIMPAHNEAASPPATGFMAGDLIDHQSLPDWMKSEQQSPPIQSRAMPLGNGFSAGDLIDHQSLPKWLQEQQGREKAEPVSAMGVPVSGSGQGTGMGRETFGSEGMPASMLLDVDALPGWMQEQAPGAAPAPEAQRSDRMAAGSLIDPNALPAWLRNSDTPQPGNTGGTRNVPPRFDAGRVPSRPRTESTSKEQSEMAANVFASMLGVAASTPGLPGQAPVPTSGYEGMNRQPSQPMTTNWQSQPQQAAYQNAQPQAWQLSEPGLPPQDYRAGSQPEFNPSLMGNANLGEPTRMSADPSQRPTPGYGYTGAFEPNRGDAGASAPVPGTASYRGNPAEGTKKKGIFEAIRDFFFK